MRIRVAAPVLVLLALGAFVSGCSRGLPREERQVVIVPDMEVQKKFKAQGYTPLFEDGRMMRTPPAGTIARGTLKGDSTYYAGSVDGVYVERSPVPFTSGVMARGRERYGVYCAPCHDQTGAGQGLVIAKGFAPPPRLFEQRLVDYTDGQLYWTISNGVRNMPGYAHQIPEEDRWAIVAYVRALQRARNATLEDVPASERDALR